MAPRLGEGNEMPSYLQRQLQIEQQHYNGFLAQQQQQNQQLIQSKMDEIIGKIENYQYSITENNEISKKYIPKILDQIKLFTASTLYNFFTNSSARIQNEQIILQKNITEYAINLNEKLKKTLEIVDIKNNGEAAISAILIKIITNIANKVLIPELKQICINEITDEEKGQLDKSFEDLKSEMKKIEKYKNLAQNDYLVYRIASGFFFTCSGYFLYRGLNSGYYAGNFISSAATLTAGIFTYSEVNRMLPLTELLHDFNINDFEQSVKQALRIQPTNLNASTIEQQASNNQEMN